MSKKTLMIIGVVVVLALGFFMTQTANKPAEQPVQEEAKAPEKAAFTSVSLPVQFLRAKMTFAEQSLRSRSMAMFQQAE